MDEKTFKDWKKELEEKGVTLVAVSKTRTNEEVVRVYDWGHWDFGENRIQEIKRRSSELPADIRWHLIGPLQSKKVKLLDDNIHLFHAVDRWKILRMCQEHFSEMDHVQDILLQVHIAREESKHGFSPEEVLGLYQQGTIQGLSHIRVRGLMGMATNTDDQNIVRSEFEGLNDLFEQIQKEYYPDSETFDILSMGMSGDYEIAIDCGATMIRVGTKIFGPRQY